jgi:hypothetical protein
MLFGIGALGFFIGQQVTGLSHNSEIASLKSQYEQKISQYEQKLLETKQAIVRVPALQNEPSRTPDLQYEGGFYIPESENVPSLSEAKPSDLSMAEFASLYPAYVAEHNGKTTGLISIQKPVFPDKYAGMAYTWSGYVSDVRREGTTEHPEYCVDIRLDREQKHSFSATCVFMGKQQEEVTTKLIRDQKVTIRGVRAKSGRLKDCDLVGSAGQRATGPATNH